MYVRRTQIMIKFNHFLLLSTDFEHIKAASGFRGMIYDNSYLCDLTTPDKR
jgi:hypothetical protein